MKPFLNLTRAGLKAFMRDRPGLFWSFFFPVFFIIIFGSIFNRSEGEGGGVRLDIGLVTAAGAPLPAWVRDVFAHAFTIHERGLEKEKQALLEGKNRAVVELPARFEESLFTGN